jgi:hypothetical protein
MSERAARAKDGSHPSEATGAFRILLAGLAGAAGGFVLGGAMYGSLVVGIFGALGGAICGLIAAAYALEAQGEQPAAD